MSARLRELVGWLRRLFTGRGAAARRALAVTADGTALVYVPEPADAVDDPAARPSPDGGARLGGRAADPDADRTGPAVRPAVAAGRDSVAHRPDFPAYGRTTRTVPGPDAAPGALGTAWPQAAPRHTGTADTEPGSCASDVVTATPAAQDPENDAGPAIRLDRPSRVLPSLPGWIDGEPGRGQGPSAEQPWAATGHRGAGSAVHSGSTDRGRLTTPGGDRRPNPATDAGIVDGWAQAAQIGNTRSAPAGPTAAAARAADSPSRTDGPAGRPAGEDDTAPAAPPALDQVEPDRSDNAAEQHDDRDLGRGRHTGRAATAAGPDRSRRPAEFGPVAGRRTARRDSTIDRPGPSAPDWTAEAWPDPWAGGQRPFHDQRQEGAGARPAAVPAPARPGPGRAAQPPYPGYAAAPRAAWTGLPYEADRFAARPEADDAAGTAAPWPVLDGTDAHGDPWPPLLDDAALWTVPEPSRADPDRINRLRREQEGQPWNA
ncbi:hypothetical protein Cs7R123_01030 [Catellatospora sp. TT07R-123]|uniref:hypothetical protein n=1 Tax=Catellatospora sp. TT07R-123 TaxID=2733863 RepID=UPI001AFCEED5|nr:hypothetical protein [Catellatospora sp. TT07R-123]GHJ42761.1 hypothetical protein Cs7R123_01030 [Catellatospora sp. TT07R-123]